MRTRGNHNPDDDLEGRIQEVKAAEDEPEAASEPDIVLERDYLLEKHGWVFERYLSENVKQSTASTLLREMNDSGDMERQPTHYRTSYNWHYAGDEKRPKAIDAYVKKRFGTKEKPKARKTRPKAMRAETSSADQQYSLPESTRPLYDIHLFDGRDFFEKTTKNYRVGYRITSIDGRGTGKRPLIVTLSKKGLINADTPEEITEAFKEALSQAAMASGLEDKFTVECSGNRIRITPHSMKSMALLKVYGEYVLRSEMVS